jgi:hypothetical protein
MVIALVAPKKVHYVNFKQPRVLDTCQVRLKSQRYVNKMSYTAKYIKHFVDIYI